MRILCADDNPEFLKILSLGLASHGHTVTTASNGNEGLNQFAAHQGHFEVIITDMDMPQLDGLAFITALRQKGYSGRIIVMSGNMDKARLKSCCEQRVGGFFQKPFPISSLLTLLKSPTPKPSALQPYQ